MSYIRRQVRRPLPRTYAPRRPRVALPSPPIATAYAVRAPGLGQVPAVASGPSTSAGWLQAVLIHPLTMALVDGLKVYGLARVFSVRPKTAAQMAVVSSGVSLAATVGQRWAAAALTAGRPGQEQP